MMLSSFVISVALAALYFAVKQGGKWKQRALSAENQNRNNRKAHDIQNDVALNSDFRERVRRHFDHP